MAHWDYDFMRTCSNPDLKISCSALWGKQVPRIRTRWYSRLPHRTRIVLPSKIRGLHRRSHRLPPSLLHIVNTLLLLLNHSIDACPLDLETNPCHKIDLLTENVKSCSSDPCRMQVYGTSQALQRGEQLPRQNLSCAAGNPGIYNLRNQQPRRTRECTKGPRACKDTPNGIDKQEIYTDGRRLHQISKGGYNKRDIQHRTSRETLTETQANYG